MSPGDVLDMPKLIAAMVKVASEHDEADPRACAHCGNEVPEDRHLFCRPECDTAFQEWFRAEFVRGDL